ncbi:transposable element Tc3 transposase [Trichonephila clavipes]|nr:transposable element Tc3 transposase [Trichonephila clavipes]
MPKDQQFAFPSRLRSFELEFETSTLECGRVDLYVMFSDESRFRLSSDSRRVTIWRERGTRFEPRNITERHHFSSRGVMVWAGLMMDGHTDLHLFDTGL